MIIWNQFAHIKEVFPIGFDQRSFVFDEQPLILDELPHNRKKMCFIAARNIDLCTIQHRKNDNFLVVLP